MADLEGLDIIEADREPRGADEAIKLAPQIAAIFDHVGLG